MGNAKERLERRIKKAREADDKAALAIMEADRRYTPDAADHLIFSAPVRRWTKAAA